MKKCPKCGTVLDDSKKTCYMCGTVLNNNSPLNFGETFDSQIGATVSKNQDNAFNNVNTLNSNNSISDIYNNKSGGKNNFQSKISNNLFQDQMNNLNSVQYDERTALEKIFSNDTRFKSKEEMKVTSESLKGNNVNVRNNKINNEISNNMPINNAPMDKGPVSNNFVNNGPINNMPMNNAPMNNVPPTNTQYSSAYVQQPTMPMPKSKNSVGNNASINWGDNLKDTNKGSKFRISLSFIFNSLCLLLFIGLMVFLYFNYFKPKQNESVEFGSLLYTIDPDFNLKTNDSNSRYYTRGEKCTIRITYEKINDVDGYISNYFDSLIGEYESMEGYNVDKAEMKIDGNAWQELTVSTLQENPSGVGGYSSSSKYKFTAIVYKGTVYDIRYSNLDEDGECSAKYERFINTLKFKED